jgi:uncharacterized protein (DUF58 family)
MRTVLQSLTTRGRAFVSAGVTSVVCALLLGLDDLARVGGLLVVLPLLTGVVVTRGKHRLGLSRTVAPTRIAAGQPARVELSLSNEGRSPTGLLLLEEQVPYALGVRPRFIIDRMGSRWRRMVSYTVRSDVRGRFTLGPMTVRVNDPFGLVELDRTFHATTSLVVTPPVVELPPIPLSGVWTGSGDNRPRDFAGGSAEDVTVRDYRQGDELRRVHWRASAHAGELMVRREEQPWQSRATLFVDNRRHVHRGAGPAASLEYAVSAAASIAVHLTQRGFRVRLVTAEGTDTSHTWHEHGAVASEAGPLLESLAVLQPVARVGLDISWLSDAQPTGLLIAVLGETPAADAPALARMQHAAHNPLALTLDVDRWVRGGGGADPGSGSPLSASVGLLLAKGWRAVQVGPEDSVGAAWQQLGLTGRRNAPGTTGAPAGVGLSRVTPSGHAPGATR